jgi:chromosome partitioning protein
LISDNPRNAPSDLVDRGMRRVALFNIKGGVGKTAAAVNLAYLSSKSGNRTLLWDLDPQGAASYYLRCDPTDKRATKRAFAGDRSHSAMVASPFGPDLDVLPADRSTGALEALVHQSKDPDKLMRRLLKQISAGYDLLLIDCPPGLTEVAKNLLRAVDVVLAPTIPTTLSMRTLVQLGRFHRKELKLAPRAPRLIPFLSMVDCRKSLHNQIVRLVQARPESFLRTAIPNASVVEQMGIRRAPVCEFAPRSVPAAAFGELYRELLKTDVGLRSRKPDAEVRAAAGLTVSGA